jgi:hypothetical protein
MIVPKTPLPWALHAHGGVKSQGRDWSHGAFDIKDDAVYAVHAANVLPEVLSALREIMDAFAGSGEDRFPDREYDERSDPFVVAARAALTKAEGRR